jgi:biopolymer transport protein ExbD
MARRGLSKYMDRRAPQNFKIQITSMVDMFVILLVFLLKTYSTSPVNITPKDGMVLPESTSTMDPVDVLKMVVSQDAVFVDDKKIIDLDKGKFGKADIDTADPQFVRPLYEALDNHAKHAQEISKVNDAFEFEGKVLVQADRDLPYEVLKRIMYTSMMAGYSEVKLAVVGQ